MKIHKLYLSLLKKYGSPAGQWRLWCKRPKTIAEKEEVVMGAILTQQTNWKNVELAIGNMKKAKASSLERICKISPKNLEDLIKPSGFYKTKARYLLNLADFIINCGGVAKIEKTELSELRQKLLALRGVGPETADSILLYALSKPIFVIDEYTRRFAKKYKLAACLPTGRKNFSYDYLQDLFQKNLPREANLYQDFHAMIVLEGKNMKK